MAWFGFEQHLEDASGHGSPANGKSVRASSFTKRGFPRWGKPSGDARNKPRQDPLKMLQMSTNFADKKYIIYLVLAGLCFLAYVNSINNGFVSDDV